MVPLSIVSAVSWVVFEISHSQQPFRIATVNRKHEFYDSDKYIPLMSLF